MTELFLFGGKGGTGKTTSSSSIAILKATQGQKTLLVSTDPAHSTRDSFGQDFGPDPTPVKGVNNLWVVEISTDKAAANMAEDLNRDIKRNPLLRLMGMSKIEGANMILPGMDEFIAFGELFYFVMDTHHWDCVILDTAPTGHTLRFLGLPELLDAWMKQAATMTHRVGVMKGLMTGNFGGGGYEEMMELSNELKKMRRFLANPRKTSFFIVMIPEQLAVEESRRAKKILKDFNIAVKGCIINNIVPRAKVCDHCGGCSICGVRNEVQAHWLKAIEREFRGSVIAKMFIQNTGEVQGIKALRKFGQNLLPQLKHTVTNSGTSLAALAGRR